MQTSPKPTLIAARLWRSIAFGVMLALLLTGCDLQRDTQVAPNAVSEEPPEVITFAEVAENPDRYVDKLLTLRGQVGEVVTPEAFTLMESDANEHVVLVLSNAPDTPATSGNPRTPGTLLEVTGEVRNFDLAAIERDFGIQLPEDQLAAYSDKAVIAAKYITQEPFTNPTAAP